MAIDWRKTKMNVIREFSTVKAFAMTVRGVAPVTVAAILLDNGVIPETSIKREIVIEALRDHHCLVEVEEAAA